MTQVDTVVIGTVILEGAPIVGGCVAIENGKVVGVLGNASLVEARERIEYPGCLILPGIVDAHVHSRGLPEEGFVNSTRAAAAGGVTTILDMPSDELDAVIATEYFAEKKAIGEAECLVDFGLWAGATNDNLDQIAPLVEAGVVGFKMYMSESQRLGHIDDGHLLAAFQEIARCGGVGAVHAENYGITTYLMNKYRREGRCEHEMFLAARPDLAEVEAVMRAVELARYCGIDLHFVHISVARSAEYIHQQRLTYPTLTVETCPQYLLLSADSLETRGAYAKVSPPLRKPEQAEGLWAQVRLGGVDIVATDHGPHTHAEKSFPCIFDNKSGMPGVETLLPLIFSEGAVKRQIPVEKIVALLSSTPAKRFGLYPRKGALQPGSDADLVVFDPNYEWTITADQLHQASGWTAFEGIRVCGKPVLTMVRGRTVWRDGEIIGEPGHGRFIAPKRA